jgi:hypothetical protein
MRWRTAGRAALVVLAGLLARPAWAHVTSTSYSTVDIAADRLQVTVIVNANQFARAADWDRNGDKRIDSAEATAAIADIARIVGQEYFFRANGFARLDLVFTSGQADDNGAVRLVYRADLPRPTESLEVHASLERVTEPHHQHLMRVVLDGRSLEYAFDHGTDEARIAPRGSDIGALARLTAFVRLGVFHIFTGYDHLLFLAGLLLTTVTIGATIRVVTAFTVAHSITLVLATLGLVVLPERLVETAIPLTIAYVAVENLWTASFDHRWRLAFVFGLVHGFGFSNVLRELALPRAALAVSLFSFNVGVEIGQLGFVLLLFPLLKMARGTARYELIRVGASVAILLMGGYWFTTRLFA